MPQFPSYYGKTVEVFTSAFLFDDPLMIRLIPDMRRRKRFLAHYFAYRVKFGILYGEVYVTSPRIEGAAIWVRNRRRSLWKNARAGGLAFYLAVGGRMIGRLIKIGNFIDALHKQHITTDHYQLERIAVRADERRAGHMSALLNPVLEHIDDMRLPCSLETQHADNVALYSRYGFDVVARAIIPGVELPHWLMIRRPKT